MLASAKWVCSVCWQLGVPQAMAIHHPPQHAGRWARWLLIGIPPVVVVALIVTVIALVLKERADERALDADLCLLDETKIAHSAVLLLDLRKPLGENMSVLFADSLRSVTMALQANAELQIFALTNSDAAPRRKIARLCKPYDNAQLAFKGSKDKSQSIRDCDDLPAQVPTLVRDHAQLFCARRKALQTEIEQLAVTPPGGVVENAYLAEALEETSLELANASPPLSLYMLSDMIQHSAWYSHLEIDWSSWKFEEFMLRRRTQDALVGPRPATVPNVGVTIYYVPRQGITDQRRTRVAHQRFWKRYFDDAFETTAVFVDQPARKAYEVAPLMKQTTEAELIAEELRIQQAAEELRIQQAAEELRTLQEKREALLEQVAEQRAALEAALEKERRTATEPTTVREPPASAGAEEADTEATQQPSAPTQLVTQNISAASSQRPVPSATTQPPRDSLVNCSLELKQQYRGNAEYPPNMRWAHASATIAVRYVVDEDGNTVDELVAVLPESSTSDPDIYLDRFGEHARNMVSAWEFNFKDLDAPCTRRQARTTTIKFSRQMQAPIR